MTQSTSSLACIWCFHGMPPITGDRPEWTGTITCTQCGRKQYMRLRLVEDGYRVVEQDRVYQRANGDPIRQNTIKCVLKAKGL